MQINYWRVLLSWKSIIRCESDRSPNVAFVHTKSVWRSRLDQRVGIVEAMIFGPNLIVVIFVVLMLSGAPIWAIIDVASRTSTSFSAAESSKSFWIALILISLFFFGPISIIVAFVYLVNVRSRVRRYA